MRKLYPLNFPIVLCLSCVLVSCRVQSYDHYPIVPAEVPIDIKEINFGSEEIFPTSMTIVNENVVLTLQRSEKNFMIIPLDSTKNAFLAGPTGRGPMDFLNIDPYSVKAEGDGFVVADMSGLKECVVTESGVVVERVSPVTTKCLPINGFAKIGGGFVNMLTTGDKEFAVYDTQGNLKETISTYPDWSKDKESVKVFLYLKTWEPNPDGNKLAVFYSHFDKFRIINLSGKVLYEVDTDFGESEVAEKELNRICYRSNPVVTNDHIVSLHCNRGGAEIQIWDWKAQLLKRYSLPGKVTQFTFDSASGNLWWFDSSHRTSLFVTTISL